MVIHEEALQALKCRLEIGLVDALPADLEEEMLPAAAAEGFVALRWLWDDWRAGTNTFAEPGEAFYVARCDGRLVGVCGVNVDPYAEGQAAGRLRRMYVLPSFRRRGVGRRLVQQAIDGGQRHFHCLRLRTLDEGASAFYEALGFDRVENDEGATHTMFIRRGT